MALRELAPDVFILSAFPPYTVNVYLIGDVLLDGGLRPAARGLLRQLRGRTVRAHALTHVHPDHQGASHALCQALNLPLWCPEGEAAIMESGDLRPNMPTNALNQVQGTIVAGPPHPVAKGLKEGDEVGGFTVLSAPGHSRDHLAYWRESDRVLILGDVAFNINFLPLRPQLQEPPRPFTLNPTQNRDSARKLAALNPRWVCFGHGQPVAGEAFIAFAEGLPR